MKAVRTILMLVLVGGACLWFGGAVALRSAPADPRGVDAASLAAVDALVSEPGDRALLAMPTGFAGTRGYRPSLRDGLLVNPRGDCSSPVPLPRSFTPGCKRHDLGYDLLRHAAAVGHPLPASARRAIDEQLAATMRASCNTDPGRRAVQRLECTTWAGLATAAVRVNSWRQGWSVPSRESAATLAEGGGALGTAGAASVLLIGAVGTTRRRLRAGELAGTAGRWVAHSRRGLARTSSRAGRWIAHSLRGLARTSSRAGRWVAHSRRGLARTSSRAAAALVATTPRVSTSTAGALAAYASLFPGFLPRSALLQGLATVAFVLPTLGLVRRLRPATARSGRTSRGVAAAVALVMLGAGSWWADAVADGQRTAAGVAPSGATYWLVAAAVVVTAVVLGRAARWVVRHRRQAWRPAAALGVLAALLAPMTPASAADAAPSHDRVLAAASPVGAVRAYAAQRPHESLHERAARVADDLVARGGLTRSRVIVMVPTGSGWVDPAAVDGFERRFGRDVALVGMQYAAIPSWVAYLFQRDTAEQGARELASAVAERIDRLPVDERPQLHLYGESLGAVAGQAVLADPAQAARFCSALWVGSPGGATAGHGREVSLANASDPVVHAIPSLLVHPTVPDQPWLPVVSYLQAAFDFVDSLSLPTGHGHRYGPGQAAHLPTCPPADPAVR